jgi:hypothetical protein
MKTLLIPSLVISLLSASFVSLKTVAQTGPFSPEAWPTTVNPAKKVHYIVTDGGLTPPSATWLPDELQVLTGGDQATQAITIGGHDALKLTGSFLNVADTSFAEWADKDVIDILVQAYGDAALFNAAGEPRDFTFLTGTLPEIAAPVGGQVPVEAKNKKWNWILFRIANGTRASDGSHLVGSVPANALGNSQFGGVNGGTIRFESVPNIIVRAIAFGEQGAFGEPDAVNKFLPPDSCDPEPNTNLVGIDINASQTNHLSVLNDGDQTVTYQDAVGPADGKRRAVRPNAVYLNFGILDNYLGIPCNDPRAVKVCVDMYDDPAFAGAEVRFGPESYATDEKGSVATLPADRRQLMTGTGKWVRRSWTIAAVDLKGVNTGALTGGPRFASENGQVFVSRVQMAVLRTGNHPLANQDPLADCYEDPSICTGAYGSFAELDLAKDVKNGLDVGSSSGDQEMIVAEAGPTTDRRMAVRPARSDGTAGFEHQYLNFAIQNEALGPSSQPTAKLAICMTYYDDPALTGARFKPEVYSTERNGVASLGFTPDSYYVTLEGTDQWRTAYWEISDMKFNGVNQGPQAAARFVLSDKIFVTSVRYGVIRPCGPQAGVNPLASCAPVVGPTLAFALTADKKIRLTWPTSAEGFALQGSPTLSPAAWAALNVAPTVEGDQNVVVITPTGTTFYQLRK